MKTKNHGILKTLTKIQFHHKTLNLTNINPLTNWQVFILMRLNLIMNVNPMPNFVIQFFIFESILTPVFLPNLDQIAKPIFIPVSINLEIESLNLDSHIPLMEKEYEFQFFDLESTLESKSTLNIKLIFPS